jgi:hypothetical protein
MANSLVDFEADELRRNGSPRGAGGGRGTGIQHSPFRWQPNELPEHRSRHLKQFAVGLYAPYSPKFRTIQVCPKDVPPIGRHSRLDCITRLAVKEA